MLKFLKFLPLVMMFKDVTDAMQAAKKDATADRPWFLSRRFVGAVMTVVFAVISIASGVTLDANVVSSITDSAFAMVSSGGVLYGLILLIVGAIKAKKA